MAKDGLLTWDCRVRTLTGKEIELDIEPDYKVRRLRHTLPRISLYPRYCYATMRQNNG